MCISPYRFMSLINKAFCINTLIRTKSNVYISVCSFVTEKAAHGSAPTINPGDRLRQGGGKALSTTGRRQPFLIGTAQWKQALALSLPLEWQGPGVRHRTISRDYAGPGASGA